MTFVAVKRRAGLRLVLLGIGLEQDVVKVAAAEMAGAFGGEDLDVVAFNFEDRRVQRPAAQVKHQDAALHALGVGVVNRRRRRLVHQTLHLHACHFSGGDGALACQFVEVCRHGDDDLGDVAADLGAVTLQLGQDERGDFRRRPFLAVDFHQMLRVVHVAFDLEDGAVGFATVASGAADELHVLMRIEEHHGVRQSLTVGVRHDFRVAIRFQVGQPGEGGAKIDSNVFSHNSECKNVPEAGLLAGGPDLHFS